MSPKEVRLKIAVQDACDIEGGLKYKELIEIIIDEFGVRHIEALEDKMFTAISKFKEYEKTLQSIAKDPRNSSGNN